MSMIIGRVHSISPLEIKNFNFWRLIGSILRCTSREWRREEMIREGCLVFMIDSDMIRKKGRKAVSRA